MKNKIFYTFSVIFFAITALCEGLFLCQIFNRDNLDPHASYSIATEYFNFAFTDNGHHGIELPDLTYVVPEYEKVVELTFNPYHTFLGDDVRVMTLTEFYVMWPDKVDEVDGSNNISIYISWSDTPIGRVMCIAPDGENLVNLSSVTAKKAAIQYYFTVSEGAANIFSGFESLRVLDMSGVFVKNCSNADGMLGNLSGLKSGKMPIPLDNSITDNMIDGNEMSSEEFMPFGEIGCPYQTQAYSDCELMEFPFDKQHHEEGHDESCYDDGCDENFWNNFWNSFGVDPKRITQVYFNSEEAISNFNMSNDTSITAESVNVGPFTSAYGEIQVYISSGNWNVYDAYSGIFFDLGVGDYTSDVDTYGEPVVINFVGNFNIGHRINFSPLKNLCYVDMSGAWAYMMRGALAASESIGTIPRVKSGTGFMGYVMPIYVPYEDPVDNEDVSNEGHFFGYGASFEGRNNSLSGTGCNTAFNLYRNEQQYIVHITLDKNGGANGADGVWFLQNTSTYYDNADMSYTNKVTQISVPTKTNYIFAGYQYNGTVYNGKLFIDSNGKFASNFGSFFTEDATLTALWVEPRVVSVSLNPNGGSGVDSAVYYYYYVNKYYKDSTMLNRFDYNKITRPTQSGYTFLGYYTESTAGTQYISSTGNISDDLCYKINSSTTLFAHWRDSSGGGGGGTVTPTTYTVSVTIKSSTSSDPNTFESSTSGMDSVTANYYATSTSQSSSSISNASSSFTSAKNKDFKLTAAAKDGYLFLGFTTSNSAPSPTQAVSESQSWTISSNTSIYVWFKKVSRNKLKYDSTNKYWYFEDGKTLQSYVGDELNSEINSSIDKTTASTGELTIFTVGGTGHNVNLYTYKGEIYGAVTALQTMNLKLSGTDYAFTKGKTYWFKYEPIRWRVTDYGDSQCPSVWSGYGSFNSNFTAVSDKIVYASQLNTEEFSLGENGCYTNTMVSGYKDGAYSMDARIKENSFNYLTATDANMTQFTSQDKSEDRRTVVYCFRLRVANVEELENNFSDLRSTATDYVAFLLGINTDQYCNYFTRDVGTKYYNMTGIGVDGRVHDYYSNNFIGMRLAMTFSEGSRY